MKIKQGSPVHKARDPPPPPPAPVVPPASVLTNPHVLQIVNSINRKASEQAILREMMPKAMVSTCDFYENNVFQLNYLRQDVPAPADHLPVQPPAQDRDDMQRLCMALKESNNLSKQLLLTQLRAQKSVKPAHPQSMPEPKVPAQPIYRKLQYQREQFNTGDDFHNMLRLSIKRQRQAKQRKARQQRQKQEQRRSGKRRSQSSKPVTTDYDGRVLQQAEFKSSRPVQEWRIAVKQQPRQPITSYSQVRFVKQDKKPVKQSQAGQAVNQSQQPAFQSKVDFYQRIKVGSGVKLLDQKNVLLRQMSGIKQKMASSSYSNFINRRLVVSRASDRSSRPVPQQEESTPAASSSRLFLTVSAEQPSSRKALVQILDRAKYGQFISSSKEPKMVQPRPAPSDDCRPRPLSQLDLFNLRVRAQEGELEEERGRSQAVSYRHLVHRAQSERGRSELGRSRSRRR